MIPIRSLFDEKILNPLRDEFFNDFKSGLKNISTNDEYFGMSMVVEQKHIVPLLQTVQKYLAIVTGMKIDNLKFVGYGNIDELPLNHSLHVKLNSHAGTDTMGFYSPDDDTMYVKINKHLKKVLPIIFHEFTHAYLHRNNIKLVDSCVKPTVVNFDFESLMYKADQEEGVCELVSSLMCFIVFDCDQYPSNVDKYWIGWRLCVQSFITMANMITKQYPNNSIIWITNIAFNTLLNYIKQTNNLYKFLPNVPKDAYHRTKSLCDELH